MKLRISSVLYALLGGMLVLGSVGCSKNEVKTLSELKDEQTTAIRRLISTRSLQVVERRTNTLPETIDPKVYYKLPNGLYLRVLDLGAQGKEVKQEETRVYAQLKGYQFTVSGDRTPFDFYQKASHPPIEFVYTYFYNAGDIHYRALGQTAPQFNYDYLMCEGIAFPISLEDESITPERREQLALDRTHVARLGNGARVSMIIPFELGPVESYSDGISIFIEEAEYFIK